MKHKRITITKVVSKHIIGDWIATLQNLLGKNLETYEKMADKAMQQIEQEISRRELSLEWYRFQITELTNGALSVTLYGEIR